MVVDVQGLVLMSLLAIASGQSVIGVPLFSCEVQLVDSFWFVLFFHFLR